MVECLITCRMLDEQLGKVTREASELRLQSAKLGSQVSSVLLLCSIFFVLSLAIMPKLWFAVLAHHLVFNLTEVMHVLGYITL